MNQVAGFRIARVPAKMKRVILNQVAVFLIARVPARMKRVILNQVAVFLITYVPARMKRVILNQVAAFLIAHVPARMNRSWMYMNYLRNCHSKTFGLYQHGHSNNVGVKLSVVRQCVVKL